MRTRSQSKRQPGESPVSLDSGTGSSSCGESKRRIGSISPTSQVAESWKKALPLAAKRRREGESSNLGRELDESSRIDMEGKISQEHAREDDLQGCSTVNLQVRRMVEEEGMRQNKYADADELDWEEGTVSTSEQRQAFSHELGKEVIIEFTDSPCSTKQKPSRRASAEDKELAELVHKVHLLCLLARGRIVDDACNDPIIQASLLSLLPSNLLKIEEPQKLTANYILPLVSWFSSNFNVQSQSIERGSFKSNLAFALQSHKGTAEEVAALSVVLFRALNLTTRFVSILDVASLKPDSDLTGALNQDTPSMETKIFSSLATVVTSNKVNTLSPIYPLENFQDCRASERALYEKRENTVSCKKNLLKGSAANCTSNDLISCPSVGKTCNDILDSCLTKLPEGSKRKGDLEFELQLEMALQATASGTRDNEVNSEMDVFPSTSSPITKLKKLRLSKAGESAASGDGGSGAVWSRKAGPPLCWAEVYCSGETMSGRWVHVDAANDVVDGAEKVEPGVAACRRLLKYVVAFAGNGAKDVTRRYCMHWYKIAPKRVKSEWWETVLAPLNELESAATGGTEVPKHLNKSTDPESLAFFYGGLSRNSMEDMELATRALTEPFPTNQQAYKSHHLYAMERWLTKNQVLHPKGPVLGYCSGHPIYPRSCVQTLQTKQKWLREGMQVRAGEIAAKVVKRAKKAASVQIYEPEVSEEDCGEPTVELFGKWQLEPLQLPHAVNGIVPKNERGQVEVWSEKCLPPGTVHLRLPRLVPIVRRLEIDFAPAMVGFEFRNGRSLPMFDGIVVCREYKVAILEAYAEVEGRREAEEKKRNEAQALSRWYQLLSSIVTRQRLKNSYVASSSQIQNDCRNDQKNDMRPPQVHSFESNMLSVELDERPARVLRSESSYHEHIFPSEDQSLDEETSTRTKRCPCGFSIQVEEL